MGQAGRRDHRLDDLSEEHTPLARRAHRTGPSGPSWPGLSVRPTRNGVGLHAARVFPAGASITPIRGRVHHWRALLRRGGAFLDNCFRHGPETYLDPGNGPGRFLNHGCAPNAAIRKVRGTLVLFAIRRVRPGEEILIDYSTITGDDDAWRMYCRCGSRRCRRWISRFGLLPSALRRSYLSRGLVPAPVLETLDDPQP